MTSAELLEATLLGIVQGIAEFLPVSSSGHLLIVGEILRELTGRQIDPEQNLQLSVALHFGTLMSIVCVYRQRLFALLIHRPLLTAVIVATLPLVVIGLSPLRKSVESGFETPLVAGICLLVTGLLLAVSDRVGRGKQRLTHMKLPHALAIGLFQAFALLPGISRSGSTIAGGQLLGYRREAAADFSFFIAIPAILGATVLTLLKVWEAPGTSTVSVPTGMLLVGTGVSFVVGYFSLRWLLSLIARGKLIWFAIYCGIVGTATILWQICFA